MYCRYRTMELPYLTLLYNLEIDRLVTARPRQKLSNPSVSYLFVTLPLAVSDRTLSPIPAFTPCGNDDELTSVSLPLRYLRYSTCSFTLLLILYCAFASQFQSLILHRLSSHLSTHLISFSAPTDQRLVSLHSRAFLKHNTSALNTTIPKHKTLTPRCSPP